MIKIKGLVAATFAAYNSDGSINTAIIPQLVEKLIADGINGIYICGTNGEGPNLTIDERKAIAEAYITAVHKRIPVLVHVGHSSIAEARKLAKHAAENGADAISSVAAFYFKPASVQNLVACMAEIASAAPELPFYYYHMPGLTGVGMDMVEFLKLGAESIPNLAGIKYTASTLFEYQACRNFENGRFDVLFGFDEMLLSALAVGAEGAIGSTYTFAAPVYFDIVDLYRQNRHEEARQLQQQIVDMVRCIILFPSVAAQRSIMKMLGFDLGPPRLPLTALSNQDEEKLRSLLHETGFFELLEKYALRVDKS